MPFCMCVFSVYCLSDLQVMTIVTILKVVKMNALFDKRYCCYVWFEFSLHFLILSSQCIRIHC